MSEDFEYKVTTIKTSGYTRSGNVSTYWESEPKQIDMSQYIPIEWIKDYIMTTYCTEYDNPQLKGIERLLEDWEKENDG